MQEATAELQEQLQPLLDKVEAAPKRPPVDRSKYPYRPRTDMQLIQHAQENPPSNPVGFFKWAESVKGSGKLDVQVYVPPKPFVYGSNAAKRLARAKKKAERLDFVQREARRRKVMLRDIRASMGVRP